MRIFHWGASLGTGAVLRDGHDDREVRPFDAAADDGPAAEGTPKRGRTGPLTAPF